MTIAPPLEAPPAGSIPSVTTETDRRARISFRQPVSTSGALDAAWWPRTNDLMTELPALLEALWTAGREVRHVTYHLGAWNPAPRRVRIDGHLVRLGGFATSDPRTIRVTDLWGRERIDILVVPPDTDPAVAQRALSIASVAESAYTPSEVLARAADPAADDATAQR